MQIRKVDPVSFSRRGLFFGEGRTKNYRRDCGQHAEETENSSLGLDEFVGFEGPEPCRTTDAAGVAVLGDYDGSVRFAAEDIFLQAMRDVVIEARHLRNAAAEHDDVGIEDVDQLRQAAR